MLLKGLLWGYSVNKCKERNTFRNEMVFWSIYILHERILTSSLCWPRHLSKSIITASRLKTQSGWWWWVSNPINVAWCEIPAIFSMRVAGNWYFAEREIFTSPASTNAFLLLELHTAGRLSSKYNSHWKINMDGAPSRAAGETQQVPFQSVSARWIDWRVCRLNYITVIMMLSIGS